MQNFLTAFVAHQAVDPLGYPYGIDRQVPGNYANHICSRALWRK